MAYIHAQRHIMINYMCECVPRHRPLCVSRLSVAMYEQMEARGVSYAAG